MPHILNDHVAGGRSNLYLCLTLPFLHVFLQIQRLHHLRHRTLFFSNKILIGITHHIITQQDFFFWRFLARLRNSCILIIIDSIVIREPISIYGGASTFANTFPRVDTDVYVSRWSRHPRVRFLHGGAIPVTPLLLPAGPFPHFIGTLPFLLDNLFAHLVQILLQTEVRDNSERLANMGQWTAPIMWVLQHLWECNSFI